MTNPWTTCYRWEWFHRDHWLGSFRERKRGSPTAFKMLIDERGGGPVLDASCGLGLKTIVMKELGLDVTGSDSCAFAVEKARELAVQEQLDIKYVIARWEELPLRTNRQFAGIFNDALSWLETRDEFAAVLKGLHEALSPGGVLVFMGATQDSPSDAASRKQHFEDYWRQRSRFALGLTTERDALRCTDLVVCEKGEMCVDEHRLYLIEEAGRLRLETATMRQPCWWSWVELADLFHTAGFSSLQTRVFPGLGTKGSTFTLNVAVKGN